MSVPVKIIAVLKAHPGKVNALKTLLEGMVNPTRNEAGNIHWDIWHDPKDPSVFVLDELYISHSAIAAHRETAHYTHYLTRINELADRKILVLDPYEII